MFVADCDSDEIKKEASKLLKTLDIKHRLKKVDQKQGDKKDGVFKVRLEKLRLMKVKIDQYDQPVGVPAFVVELCNYLRHRIDTDGLFRKSGGAMRQKELKQLLLNGGKLADSDYKATDVADLLKLFFRELPEPCIPYAFHDILQRCLENKERPKEAIFLALLLFPNDYLYTLAYLMQFLQEVAAHRESNRMDISNLAIVWTPNLMPFKPGHVNDKHILEKRLSVIGMLIEDAKSIGVVPESLCEHLSNWQPSCSVSSHDELESSKHKEKKKKKRRSGSLTRMLSGIKRMVGKSGPEDNQQMTPEQPQTPPVPHTPRIMSTAKKRKASETNLLNFSAKKRKDLLELLPQGALLPDVCCTTHLTPRVLIAQPVKGLPEETVGKPKSRFYTNNQSTERDTQKQHGRSLSGSRIRLSHFGLGRKHKKKAQANDDSGLEITSTPDTLDLSSRSEDYVRISRSEYEDIKNRVSRIESRISSEFENIEGISMSDLEITLDRSSLGSVKTVQSVYERTLESAEKLHSPTSEELARRFSRELKIRGSSSKKIIRSPSARKIGSLRRRSRENAPKIRKNLSLNTADRSKTSHQFYPENSLRRGKPNTVCNGLPEPLQISTNKGRCHSNDQMKADSFKLCKVSLNVALETGFADQNSFGVLTRSQARRASSFHGCDLSKETLDPLRLKQVNNNKPDITMEWKNAEEFLKNEKIEEKQGTGRPSIAKLRSQNAGMVMAKAKLFNTMVGSDKVSPLKAFRTNQISSTKNKDNKKISSSKDQKVYQNDSQNNRRNKKDNLVSIKPTKQLIKSEANIALRRGDCASAIDKENLLKDSLGSPRTSKYVLKSTQRSNKKGFNTTSTQVASPLKERNHLNNAYGCSPRLRRDVGRVSAMSGQSSSVSRQSPTLRHELAVKVISSTPRRSPRQLLLKSRHLS